MQDTPEQPVKKRNLFDWNFAKRTRLENTAANQTYVKKVKQKTKKYLKKKHIELRRWYGIPKGTVVLVSDDKEQKKRRSSYRFSCTCDQGSN